MEAFAIFELDNKVKITVKLPDDTPTTPEDLAKAAHKSLDEYVRANATVCFTWKNKEQ